MDFVAALKDLQSKAPEVYLAINKYAKELGIKQSHLLTQHLIVNQDVEPPQVSNLTMRDIA